MKEEVGFGRNIKFTIGLTLMVLSGASLGVFGTLGFIMQLDKSILWLPLGSILLLIIGECILLYREDQIKEEYCKTVGKRK